MHVYMYMYMLMYVYMYMYMYMYMYISMYMVYMYMYVYVYVYMYMSMIVCTQMCIYAHKYARAHAMTPGQELPCGGCRAHLDASLAYGGCGQSLAHF